MRILRIAVLAAAVIVFFFSANAQAQMVRVFVDAWTSTPTDPAYQQLQMRVSAYEATNDHAPTYVKAIKVDAPDGSIFYLDPLKDWLAYHRFYVRSFYASDFKYGKIPSGTYRVTVTHISGSAITESDSVVAEFLPVSTVTYPANNATAVPARPTFTWTTVLGATYYRVLLWNRSRDEPVYYEWSIQLNTDLTKVTMPPGILKPNSDYWLRIEARSGSQDLDKRSRSDYVYFRTDSW
jgi:hypothetical protein